MKTPPKDRGPLGISLWLDFDCSIVMEVPRSCFRPQPEVDSSVIGLKPISRDHINEKERLSIKGLASWCFGRRRRKIRNSLIFAEIPHICAQTQEIGKFRQIVSKHVPETITNIY